MTADGDALPEVERNELLRRVDWRFLLGQEEAPLIADLTSGRDSRALELVGRGEPVPGAADVAAIGFPTRLALRGALDSVRRGGAVVCLWRTPRPGGAGIAAARLRRAGLIDVRVLWPGPTPRHPPQFWLPLESPQAVAHLLANRPPASRPQAVLRPLWRAAARGGFLAPLCVIGRLPAAAEGGPDEIEAALPADSPPLLLTAGARSINKAVALPLAAGETEPARVVKFARVAAADAALEREAAALRAIESRRPDLGGVPRLLGEGRRAGRRALAESAVNGSPLIAGLTPERFEDLAGKVTAWLTELARDGEPSEPGEWWERLVGSRLRSFERDFGPVLPPGLAARLEEELSGLGPLPLVPEHRDCSPWNVVLVRGEPGLLDWESAEPRGLPGLDLAYFLANCAFVLDGALESGRIRESYERLLDPTTPYGEVAARCERRYREALGIDPSELTRLRLLAWLVHTASDRAHLAMESAGEAPESPSPEALRASPYLGLIEAELS